MDSQIDLAQAAKLAQLDYQELRRLNPGYLQWATHPDNPQVIAVPIDHAGYLKTGIENLGPDRFITWDRYEIKPGDTLSGIALKIQTEVEVLRSVNQITGNRIIAGDALLVPRTTDPTLLANITKNQRTSRRVLPIPNEYIVRNGDNLWTIARRFNIKSKDVALWNNISVNSILQPGQELNLAFLKNPSTATEISNNSTARDYRVQSGDSMIGIAKRFSIDLNKLLNWNNLMPNDLIFPGQLIRIIPPETN